MLIDLSDEQRALQQAVRRFAEKEVGPRAALSDSTAAYPTDLFAAMRRADTLGIAIPQEFGGSGGGMSGLCIAIEEVCRYDNSAGLMLLLTRLAAGRSSSRTTPR